MTPPVLRTKCRTHQACGCWAARCCLDCPLPDCGFGPGRRNTLARLRRQRVAELWRQGLSPMAIAEQLGVPRITVYHDLKVTPRY